MRLDHLIATVPDLRATHGRLLEMGFDEAWPPGPFWPVATTSGVALGGANLELVQPDAGVDRARIDTLVLAPASLEEGRRMIEEHGELSKTLRKVEPDPALLALRGFSAEDAARPQPICTNQYPADPPYSFFLCLYVPFLKARLAPVNFASPRGPIVSLSLSAPDPQAVRRLFAGHIGEIGLEVEEGLAEVTAIRFADGSTLSAQEF